MNLAETQQAMAAALFVPLSRNDGIARRRETDTAARLIKPNSRLASGERLEIYCRGYWFRLLDSLREDFPRVATILGPRAFERLARAYLAECPSQSFTLRNLGRELESWLRRNPRYGGARPRLVLDVVRLEWAEVVAFDGPSAPPLSPPDLVDLRPDTRLGLQPHITLLDATYAVDEIRAGRPVRIRPRPVFLAVHRADLTVCSRRLSREEFQLLSALRAGRSIAHAIGVGFRDSATSAGEIPQLLETWFAAWSQLGWLTPRRRRTAKEHQL